MPERAEKRSIVKLSLDEQRYILGFLGDYLKDEKVQMMRQYMQHGAVSTYEHCMRVTCASFWMNQRLHLGADEKVLLPGAFLHDFYLYDWHNTSEHWHRLHGFRHPEFARKNAKEHFQISEEVAHIIKSHMWPLTITKVPTSREAAIVCLADKYVSSMETIAKRRRKKVNVVK